jgi:hypothetical protein
LLAKPTQLNINLSSDRFAMFNKERDISLEAYERHKAEGAVSIMLWGTPQTQALTH